MYTVALGCKEYATGQDTIVDVLKVTTPAIDYNVNVLKVGLTGVSFNLKLDPTFVLDQTNSDSSRPIAVLYGKDGAADVLINSTPINIAAAIAGGGWTAQIDYLEDTARSQYSNFSIKLENTYYQGSPVFLQGGIYANSGATFSVSRTFSIEVPNSATPSTPNTDSAPNDGAANPAPEPGSQPDAGTPAPEQTDTGAAVTTQ
jgi:hypothetical protein